MNAFKSTQKWINLFNFTAEKEMKIDHHHIDSSRSVARLAFYRSIRTQHTVPVGGSSSLVSQRLPNARGRRRVHDRGQRRSGHDGGHLTGHGCHGNDRDVALDAGRKTRLEKLRDEQRRHAAGGSLQLQQLESYTNCGRISKL